MKSVFPFFIAFLLLSACSKSDKSVVNDAFELLKGDPVAKALLLKEGEEVPSLEKGEKKKKKEDEKYINYKVNMYLKKVSEHWLTKGATRYQDICAQISYGKSDKKLYYERFGWLSEGKCIDEEAAQAESKKKEEEKNKELGEFNKKGEEEKSKGNKIEANKFFTQACDKGLEIGCKNSKLLCDEGEAAVCFIIGSSEQKKNNSSEAITYLKKACDLGHAGACSNVGVLEYEKSNFEDSKKHLQKACDLGQAAGCSNLKSLY